MLLTAQHGQLAPLLERDRERLALLDEVEVARDSATRVAKLEAVVARQRERLAEAADVKRRLQVRAVRGVAAVLCTETRALAALGTPAR